MQTYFDTSCFNASDDLSPKSRQTRLELFTF